MEGKTLLITAYILTVIMIIGFLIAIFNKEYLNGLVFLGLAIFNKLTLMEIERNIEKGRL